MSERVAVLELIATVTNITQVGTPQNFPSLRLKVSVSLFSPMDRIDYEIRIPQRDALASHGIEIRHEEDPQISALVL